VTTTRVTQRTVNQLMLSGLQGNLGQLQKLQEGLSTGRRINRPSDDPVGTDTAMQYRGQIRRTEQYQRNAQDGLNWLGMADQAMQGGVNLIRRAQTLLSQGINGASGPDARAALAAEIDSIRQSMLGVANTTYLGRPIFGGTTASSSAYADDGTGTIVYQGDTGVVNRTVADGTTVPVNVDRTAAFGPDGDDIFAALAAVSDHLRNDPSALTGDIDKLQGAMRRMTTALADEGAKYNRVDLMNQAADSALVDLKAGLSETENVDLPATIVELQMQQVAYQAALGATAKIVQPSLVDFLR
jgi:flagellar hook-associated protein 3 FlgL